MTRMWLGAALLVATAASAQDNEEPQGAELAPGSRPIRYKERTEIEFGDELEVNGELMRPSVTLVNARPQSHSSSFVWLRKDWEDELTAAAHGG